MNIHSETFYDRNVFKIERNLLSSFQQTVRTFIKENKQRNSLIARV